MNKVYNNYKLSYLTFFFNIKRNSIKRPMVAQKKGEKKADEKKIKKASLSQVVEHLNNNQEEDEIKNNKTEASTKTKKPSKDKKKADNKENQNKEVVPVGNSSPQQLVHVSESSLENIDVEPVDFTEDGEASKESEEYSKKKIRQEQSNKKRKDKRKKESKQNPEKKEEEIKTKRVKRATAVEQPLENEKKLTRKERKEMKIKNKGAGLSSKDFVRLIKEGENKDLKDVPFEEGKGINQLPTRTKSEAIAKKPLKKAKGDAVPRGRTRTAPKDKKKK